MGSLALTWCGYRYWRCRCTSESESDGDNTHLGSTPAHEHLRSTRIAVVSGRVSERVRCVVATCTRGGAVSPTPGPGPGEHGRLRVNLARRVTPKRRGVNAMRDPAATRRTQCAAN